MNPVSVMSFGAVGDGVTDDTAAIQAAVDTCSGSDRVTFPAQQFRINGLAGIKLRSNKCLELGDATVVCVNIGARCKAFETVPGAENVTIVGGTLSGSHTTMPAGSWAIGVRVDQASNVLLDGTNLINWYTDGIWIGGNPQNPSYNVQVRNVMVSGAKRNGMSISSVLGVYVDRSVFQNTRNTDTNMPRAGVDVEPNAGDRADDVWFTNCTFRNNEGAGLLIQRGHGLPGNRYVVLKNEMHNNGTYGLVANAMDGLDVRWNFIRGGKKGASIGLGAKNVVLMDNDIGGCTDHELVLASVENLTMGRNNINGGTIAMVGVMVDGVARPGVYGRVVME